MTALSPSSLSLLPCPSSLPLPSLFHRPLPGPDAFIRRTPRPPGGASALLLRPGWLSSVSVCLLLFVILFWVLGWLLVLSWDLLGRGRGPRPGRRARLCLLHATSPVIRVQIPAPFGTVVLRGVQEDLRGCGVVDVTLGGFEGQGRLGSWDSFTT